MLKWLLAVLKWTLSIVLKRLFIILKLSLIILKWLIKKLTNYISPSLKSVSYKTWEKGKTNKKYWTIKEISYGPFICFGVIIVIGVFGNIAYWVILV